MEIVFCNAAIAMANQLSLFTLSLFNCYISGSTAPAGRGELFNESFANKLASAALAFSCASFFVILGVYVTKREPNPNLWQSTVRHLHIF